MRLVIRNARRLDVEKMEFVEDGPLVAEDGRIASIGENAPVGAADLEIDAKGSFMLPGFIDAHVHFRLATLDFARLQRWSEVEYGIVMARNLETTEEELIHSVFPHPTLSEMMHESVLGAYGRAIHI